MVCNQFADVLKLCACTLQLAGPVCEVARELGLIVITAGAGDVVRLVPPLSITQDDVEQCIQLLSKAIAEAV